MKTILNEELNSIKCLFDYQRGKVISEQNILLLNEENGQNLDEYPACVQQFGAPTPNSNNQYSITPKSGDFKNYDFYNNGRVNKADSTMDNYYCDSSGLVKIGVNNNAPVETDAVKIQKKLLALGKDIGPTGADGTIGTNTSKAIWEVIKDL